MLVKGKAKIIAEFWPKQNKMTQRTILEMNPEPDPYICLPLDPDLSILAGAGSRPHIFLSILLGSLCFQLSCKF